MSADCRDGTRINLFDSLVNKKEIEQGNSDITDEIRNHSLLMEKILSSLR